MKTKEEYMNDAAARVDSSWSIVQEHLKKKLYDGCTYEDVLKKIENIFNKKKSAKYFSTLYPETFNATLLLYLQDYSDDELEDICTYFMNLDYVFETKDVEPALVKWSDGEETRHVVITGLETMWTDEQRDRLFEEFEFQPGDISFCPITVEDYVRIIDSFVDDSYEEVFDGIFRNSMYTAFHFPVQDMNIDLEDQLC